MKPLFFDMTALGVLFEDVQQSGIFADSKTFNDCIPLAAASEILDVYQATKNQPTFDLATFVTTYFQIPTTHINAYHSDTTKPIEQHIDGLWDVLTREAEPSVGSLIGLPQPYIVPGGRFQEIYYWDSYFTMLGLQVSQRQDLIKAMVNNFAHLIDTLGHIPNGNRSYYVSRSQPPFFALMVALLGASTLDTYLPFIEKEYNFWMDGETHLSSAVDSVARVVRLADGTVLNRYWDALDTPRPEAFKEDVEVAQHATQQPTTETYRHLRAAAESGWDFSSRWLADGQHLSSIVTTQILPIDLNCLLYYIEKILAKTYQNAASSKASFYYKKAEQRQKAIQATFWDAATGFFFDYNFHQQQHTACYSLAACFPLFVGIATPTQAEKVAKLLETKFLQAGGLLTTLHHTGQQWDAPNGWAPLHWIAYQGLCRYGHTALAKKIKTAWLETCQKVYQNTGKMTEKYNVANPDLLGGGGEYPNQDGFGWSNGVFLALIQSNKDLSLF